MTHLYSWSMKQFGKRLRELRQGKNLSQTDLARLARIHPMQVGKYERGEIHPGLETLAALSRALDTSLDWLITGDEEPPTNGKTFRFPLLEEKLRELDGEIEKRDLPAVLSFLDAYIAKKRLKRIMPA